MDIIFATFVRAGTGDDAFEFILARPFQRRAAAATAATAQIDVKI